MQSSVACVRPPPSPSPAAMFVFVCARNGHARIGCVAVGRVALASFVACTAPCVRVVVDAVPFDFVMGFRKYLCTFGEQSD